MKIIGNTVGMGLPKPNLMQTDATKGDYIKGKEEFLKDPNLKGDKGDPFTYDDFTPEQLAALKGAKGDDGYTPIKGVDYFDGKDGVDGYTPVKGKDYFDGQNGKDGYTPVKGKDYFDGTNGKDGKDGYTPQKGVDYFDGKDGKDGTNGKDGSDGYTPVKGVDYFTEAEVEEIAQEAADKIDTSGFATKEETSQLSEQIADKVTSPNTAEVGQVIAVKAVDENGKPTEWEAVDMASGGGVQSDWNQMDETAADFIKNKPFGDELIEVIPETEVVGEPNEDSGGMFVTEFDPTLYVVAPDTLIVCFDGVQYICPKISVYNEAYYGNIGVFGEADTGEPFVMCLIPNVLWMCILPDGEPHSVSISEFATNPIDPKYIPIQATPIFYINNAEQKIYNDIYATDMTTRQQLTSAIEGSGAIFKTGGNTVVFPIGINYSGTEAVVRYYKYPTTDVLYAYTAEHFT